MITFDTYFQIQNIVIIQAPGSKQLLVPHDAVRPVSSCSCLVDKCVETNPQPHRCYTQIGGSSQSSSSPSCCLYNIQTNARAVISDNTGNTMMTNLASDPGSHSSPHNVEVTDEVSGDTPSVILSKDIASNGSDAKEMQSPSRLKTSEFECEPMSEEEDLNKTDNVMDSSTRVNTNDDQGKVHSESYDRMRMDNVSQNQKTVVKDNFDGGTVSENEYISQLTVESKKNETAGEIKNNKENKDIDISLEEKSQSVLSVDFVEGELDSLSKAPEKAKSTTLSSIPTPYLPISSLLTTPSKSDERGTATVCLSMSPLRTPVISVPSPDKSLHTPVKAVNEIRRTDFSCILEEREIRSANVSSVLERHLEAVVPCTSVAPVLPGNKDRLLESRIPLPSAEVDKEKGRNRGKENKTVDEVRNSDICKTRSSGKNCTVQKTQQPNHDKTREKLSTQMNAVARNQVTPQSSSVTLVTSVYQSPIFSSGVRNSGSLNVLNITPQKAKTSLWRISPAKGFRSPMKTSPLKQVSPILRKYHKYSPKKRRLMSSNKKLSPILPKISVSISSTLVFILIFLVTYIHRPSSTYTAVLLHSCNYIICLIGTLSLPTFIFYFLLFWVV